MANVLRVSWATPGGRTDLLRHVSVIDTMRSRHLDGTRRVNDPIGIFPKSSPSDNTRYDLLIRLMFKKTSVVKNEQQCVIFD
jgi:hypothetical protein